MNFINSIRNWFSPNNRSNQYKLQSNDVHLSDYSINTNSNSEDKEVDYRGMNSIGQTRSSNGSGVPMKFAIASLAAVLLGCLITGLIVHFTTVKVCLDSRSAATTTQTPPQTTTTLATTTTSPPIDKDVRLPPHTKPMNYKLTLAPNMYTSDPKKFTFVGSVDITIKCQQSTNSIKIHSQKLNFTKDNIKVTNTANGNEVSISTMEFVQSKQWVDIQLTASLESGKMYKVSIDQFVGPLADDLRGLYYSSYKENGVTKYLATSQLQATDARKTFPCYDEPAIKATFDVTLVHKSSFEALANMENAATTNLNAAEVTKWKLTGLTGQFVRTKYFQTPIMSTYLLAFVVSEFNYLSDRDDKGRLYRNYARPELYKNAAYATKAVVNMTNYFEQYFDVKYPLNKTDQVAVPDFNAGAMENWGLIIYRESRLLYNETTDTVSAKQAIGAVIAHELAHQWFGNLVTPSWWDDIWLNEGFATFVTQLAVQNYHPDWDWDSQFVIGGLRLAFQVDSRGSSHPIYQPIYNPVQINQIFDTITYRKGASVLRMMYYFLGDETFKKGIGNYLRQNSYSDTNHTELYKALSKQYLETHKEALDVKKVMDTWVLQMGHPVVTVTSKSGDMVSLEQKHFLSDESQVPDPEFPSPYEYIWRIPLTIATKDTYSTVYQQLHNVTWMHTKKHTLKISGIDKNYYLLNVRGASFYRVNYDYYNWKILMDQLMLDHTVFHTQDRAKIIDDAFTLAKAGQLSYEIPLNLSLYLTKETDYVPWEAALLNFQYFHSMLNLQNSLYGNFAAYMRHLLNNIYMKYRMTKDDSLGHLERRLQASIVKWSCTYGVRQCETDARELFDKWKNDNSVPILPDVRSKVFCEGVGSSFVTVWDMMFDKLENETNPDMINDLIASLACSYEPWILQRYLEYTLQYRNVKRQDTSRVFSRIASNPNGMLIIWEFIQNNWRKIAEDFPQSFTTGYFISVLSRFNTEQKLEELKQFKEKQKDYLGSAKQTMDQTIDEVLINSNWMKKHLNVIKSWLNDRIKNLNLM